MNRRRHYSLLLVRSDGARILDLSVPGRAAVWVGAALAAVISLFGALLGDNLHLRRLIREDGTYAAVVTRQQKTLDHVNARVAALQREAAEWRGLHARIWDAVSPETAGPRGPGIGGPSMSFLRAVPKLFPIEDLERLTDSVRVEAENLRALEGLMMRAGTILAALPSRWPVRGVVNSEFGSRQSPWGQAREMHSGIDIGAQQGTPVHAPADGTVAFAGHHPEYGLTVMLDHGQDIQTVYGHLSRIAGHPGQRMERGAFIGLTGNTGRSSGPHLHYEILVKGRAVDPRGYLWD